MAEICHYAFDNFASFDTVRVSIGFDWHLLDSQHVHLVLNFETKDVRSVGLHRFTRRENGQSEFRAVNVVAGHVDDATTMDSTGHHLGSKESGHHKEREGVDVGRFDDFLIGSLVNLAFSRVVRLNIVDQDGDVVDVSLSVGSGLDRLAKLLILLPGGLVLEVEYKGGSGAMLRAKRVQSVSLLDVVNKDQLEALASQIIAKSFTCGRCSSCHNSKVVSTVSGHQVHWFPCVLHNRGFEPLVHSGSNGEGTDTKDEAAGSLLAPEQLFPHFK